MINLNLCNNQQSSCLKDGITKWTEKHRLFISDMFDDIWSDPSGDWKGEINEQDGSLTEVFISIIVIKFWNHILKWVEWCEHDHKTYSQITNSTILLAFCETVLLYLWHVVNYVIFYTNEVKVSLKRFTFVIIISKISIEVYYFLFYLSK